MLKRITVPAAAIMAIIGYPVHAQEVTVPNTAASFSASAIPVTAGTIDFWAKLSGFSGAIPNNGPHFFIFNHDLTNYSVGFTANDGTGNHGLTGIAGRQFHTGSVGNSYEDILGTGGEDTWHHYALKWDQDGLADVPNQKVAVYLDGALASASWGMGGGLSVGTFPALPGGTLNLITGDTTIGRIAIDEFKVFDGNNNLVLYNTLDSINDVTHSAVGSNGSFNGFGDPTFVTGILGNALEATPVYLLAPIPEPETYAMMLAGLGLLGFIGCRRQVSPR
ncbi:PEP-CTERM sorting domain-containing protein [Nitrosospira sp. NpAV]|uniref:PEP-CTERM sorting domain-containing protein n=1 Tax=Nitrosospira sp. NpAV TaxID=58133 RepID=UPI001E2C6A35|nr:PEP-CTERM sorting domain-containing protein [Nitrosospira sp. NpAV]